MKSIYMPNESFVSEHEVNTINKLLINLSDNLLNEIDDRIDVWIIGNKEKDFFERQITVPMKKHKVLDPFDQLPISGFRKLQHLAIIYFKKDKSTKIVEELFYGNTDYNIGEFITEVIKVLSNKFPKSGPNNHNIDKNINKKDFKLLSKINQIGDYHASTSDNFR